MSECDDDPIWIIIIAYLGGAIMAIAPWRQVWKTFNRKTAQDISLKSLILTITGLGMAISFTSYKLILPILIPSLVEISGWLVLIFLKTCHFGKEENPPKEFEIRIDNFSIQESLKSHQSKSSDSSDVINKAFQFIDNEHQETDL